MKVWPIWLLVGIAGGCSTTARIELPAWDIAPASVAAQQPLSLPTLPPLSADGTHASIDRAGVLALLAYIETAEANTVIAAENAAALAAQAAAYNQLIDAGRFMVEIAKIKEDQLAREVEDHRADNWYYRGMIALGLALGFAL